MKDIKAKKTDLKITFFQYFRFVTSALNQFQAANNPETIETQKMIAKMPKKK
ncbi:hypothetical protein HY612_05290 [Candidatus Roizmanbacteria bacterium]|nr:hypothetical protein [Candidatus Roizmanbacteria bacterium]